MILPMLMGASPVPPMQLCLDCGSYYWLGFISAAVLAILMALAFAHYRKAKG